MLTWTELIKLELVSCSLDRSYFSRCLTLIDYGHFLSVLRLPSSNLGPEEGRVLAQFLERRDCRLLELSADHNSLGESVAELGSVRFAAHVPALLTAQALQSNKWLRMLNLQRNRSSSFVLWQLLVAVYDNPSSRLTQLKIGPTLVLHAHGSLTPRRGHALPFCPANGLAPNAEADCVARDLGPPRRAIRCAYLSNRATVKAPL